MGFAKIREVDVDLRPLLGEVSDAEHDRLLVLLRALEQELVVLAREISTHLGLEVKPYPVDLAWGDRGGAELSLGIGEFPVELYVTAVVAPEAPEPSWTWDATLNVHCELRPKGYSCLHDLYREEGKVTSPDSLVDAVTHAIHRLRDEALARSPESLIAGQHASLPTRR